MNIRQRILIAIVILAVLSSCKLPFKNPPEGYIAITERQVQYIQFTEKDGQVVGQYISFKIINTQPPQKETETISFTGTKNGTSLTVSLHGLASFTGKIEGNQLILSIPRSDGYIDNAVFVGATIEEYNQAVDLLQMKVSEQQQEYNEAQATKSAVYENQSSTKEARERKARATEIAFQATQSAREAQKQAVREANSALEDALGRLIQDTERLASFSVTDTMDRFASDWQEMQEHYAKAVKNAEAGCGDGFNYGVVEFDVGGLEFDYGTIEFDLGSLGSDEVTYKSALSALQSDIWAVKTALARLQRAVSNNPSNMPAAIYSANDVNGYLADSENVIIQAQGLWEAAKSRADQYDKDAQALLLEGKQLLKSMNCE